MIAKTILISGGFLLALVCVGLFAIALLYLGYCAVVGRLEKRALQCARRRTPTHAHGQIGEPSNILRTGAALSGKTAAHSHARLPMALNRLH